jgi:hypothetical protein
LGISKLPSIALTALPRLSHILGEELCHVLLVLHVRPIGSLGGLRLFGDQQHGGKAGRMVGIAACHVAADGGICGWSGLGCCLLLRRVGQTGKRKHSSGKNEN